jgi:hypothetical protein
MDMLLLALLGVMLSAPIYPDSLDRNTLPPEGSTRLVTVHGFDSTGRMEWAESTWVERGNGRGVRTSHSHRWTPVGHAFTSMRDVGLTNGFAVADSERIESWWDDSLLTSSLRRRIPSDLGGKWVVDAKEHDTLEIHLDGHGHEAFRREVSWELYAPTPCLAAHDYRMIWEGGQLVRSDHYGVRNGTDTLYHGIWASDFQDGERIGTTSLEIHFRSPAPPETSLFFWRSRWEGDSLRVEVSGHTGSNPVTTRFRVTRDALGRTLQEVSGEEWFGKSWGDTTQWIRDDEGQVHRIRKAYGRFGALHATLLDGSLHELSIRLYNAEDSNLSHPVRLDSTEWSDGHKVRELRYQCISPNSLEGCALMSRTEYAQRLLALPTTVHRRSATPLGVQRLGQVVRWAGAVPDGATTTLRALDGRLIAVATFRNGVAEARLVSSPPAVWTIMESGRPLATGRIVLP